MSSTANKTGKKRPRKDETETEESDYDTYSDGDSDSDDSNSESPDDAEKSNEFRPKRAGGNLSMRRHRKLDSCVLDSLLWQDLDFQEDYRLFLRNPEGEDDPMDEDALINDEDEDSDDGHLVIEVPPVVIKTEPRSDNEAEDDVNKPNQERSDSLSFILPDVPTGNKSNTIGSVQIKTEPGTEEPAQKKTKTSSKAKTSRSKKTKNPPSKPRKIHWERIDSLEGRSTNYQEKTSFTGKPGRAMETTRSDSLLSLFRLFFTPNILELIVDETNVNAEVKNAKATWFKLTPSELTAFIALNIAMGVDRRETLGSYWETYPALHTPWFGSIMSRQRFRDIHRYLSVDSDGKGPFVFYKVKPLLKLFPSQFKKLNSPSRWLVIDEQVLGTKCKMSYLQNLGLPTRPVEWGLKVFTLSDALTGYILNFYVHVGRGNDLDVHQHGWAYDIVMKLLDGYHGKGYVVFMDNFYTSPQLFLDLLDLGTLACGMSRPDHKGFPEDIANMQLNPGSSIHRASGDLTAIKWAGPTDVCCMSTYFGCKTITRQQGGTIPEILAMYNIYMGNVNVCDQPMCYFSLLRKPINWWRKVFWRIVDLTLVNMVALRRLEGLKLTNTSLRKQLVMELVKPHLAESRIHSYEPIQVESGQLIVPVSHLPIKADKRGQCTSCSKEKVKNFCTGCQKYVCMGCYESYHVNTTTTDTMEYTCSPRAVLGD